MKYARLVLKSLMRSKRRTVLTVLSIAVSLFIFSALISLPTVADSLVTPASLLFDNRANYLQSSLDVNYLKSERTVFTFGGEGFGIWRKASGLIGMEGYDLHGTIRHRLSLRTTIGVTYQHAHYDYPKAFGESDIDMYSGNYATQFGRYWTLSAKAGVYKAEVIGLQQVAVDPVIAALLGVSTTVRTFYKKTVFPLHAPAKRSRSRSAAPARRPWSRAGPR